MPGRRTFTTGILPSVHSMLAALRRAPIRRRRIGRGFAGQQRRLSGHGQPLASPFPVAQVGNLCLLASRRRSPVAQVGNLCLSLRQSRGYLTTLALQKPPSDSEGIRVASHRFRSHRPTDPKRCQVGLH
jgi:hypothetical protein